MYRISWCYKSTGKYYNGDWKEEDELSNLKEWCYKQNMIDENSYYWIEKKEEDKIKNVVDKNEYEKEYVNIFKS
jgi:hypothetical protein